MSSWLRGFRDVCCFWRNFFNSQTTLNLMQRFSQLFCGESTSRSEGIPGIFSQKFPVFVEIHRNQWKIPDFDQEFLPTVAIWPEFSLFDTLRHYKTQLKSLCLRGFVAFVTYAVFWRNFHFGALVPLKNWKISHFCCGTCCTQGSPEFLEISKELLPPMSRYGQNKKSSLKKSRNSGDPWVKSSELSLFRHFKTL